MALPFLEGLKYLKLLQYIQKLNPDIFNKNWFWVCIFFISQDFQVTISDLLQNVSPLWSWTVQHFAYLQTHVWYRNQIFPQAPPLKGPTYSVFWEHTKTAVTEQTSQQKIPKAAFFPPWSSALGSYVVRSLLLFWNQWKVKLRTNVHKTASVEFKC